MAIATFKHEVFSSLLWKFGERFGYQIVQLVVQIILARLLSPDEFGAVALIAVFITISNVFVQSGLNTALIRFKHVTEDDYSTVFWFSLLMACGLYLVIFITSSAVSFFYMMPVLESALRVLALQLFFNALNSVQVAKISRDLKFRKLFFSTLVAILVSGSAGVALAFAGWGVWALVAQQLLNQVISCLTLFFLVDWRPYFVFRRDRLKMFWSFGWKILCSSLLDAGNQGIYDLVIGKAFSNADLGLFSQGKKIPYLLCTLFDGSIQSVMLPALSRFQDNKEQMRHAMSRAMSVSSFCIAPIMAFLIVGASPLVSLLLTDKWLACVPFMQICCLAYALWPIHTSNLQSINALGRSDMFFKLEIIKVSASIVLLLLSTVVFRDIYVVAWMLVVSGVVSIFVNTFPMRKMLGYGPFAQLRDILPAYALSFVVGTLGYLVTFFQWGAVPTLFLELFVVFVFYIILAKAFKLPAFDYILSLIAERFSHKKK